MRSPLSIFALLLAFAPAVVAQNSNSDSLADVARQSRTHAGAAKKSWDDQNSDFGRTAEDSGTPCGAPLAGVQDGYISELMGKDNIDLDTSKALVHWLDKHPDLDVMHPEDIARIDFPRTPSQIQNNQATAKAAAARWVSESASAPAPSPGDPNAAAAPSVNPTFKSNAGLTLAQAVRNEQQRRVRSDGSPADKLAEAVNLYSICESRRQLQFEGEVDQLAKQEYRKHLLGTTEVAQGK